MFAIFQSGGAQHSAKVGSVVSLQTLNANVGDQVVFSEVFFFQPEIGEHRVGCPILDGICVKGEVLSAYRDKKITIVKFRRRKHSMKKQGHRQALMKVRITAIEDTKNL